MTVPKKNSKIDENKEVMKMLKHQLDRMETKIDKLDERLDSAEKVAIKQEANLEAHMKRSGLLEQSQGELKDSSFNLCVGSAIRASLSFRNACDLPAPVVILNM